MKKVKRECDCRSFISQLISEAAAQSEIFRYE